MCIYLSTCLWFYIQISPTGGAVGDNFGVSVSLSANNIAVGASGDASDMGAVYMYGFVVDGSSFDFPLEAKLVPSELGSGSLFGASVCLYEGSEVGIPEYDGAAIIAAGAPGHLSGNGSVFVYFKPDAANASVSWSQQATLAAPAGVTSFGQSVSVFEGILAVGGVTSDGGVVYMYRLDSTSMEWAQEAALVPSDRTTGDGFGSSLSMYIDVTSGFEAVLLLVGAPSVSAAYIMIYDPRISSWIQHSKLESLSSTDQFGYSVSAYEGSLAVGAPLADGGKGGVTVYKPYNNSNRVAWEVQSNVSYCVSVPVCIACFNNLM
jgi:hypothetical protein